MTERQLEEALLGLEYLVAEDGGPVVEGLELTTSFGEAGILTRNRGVMFRMADGSEFQLTIVRSSPPRRGTAGEDEGEGE